LAKWHCRRLAQKIGGLTFAEATVVPEEYKGGWDNYDYNAVESVSMHREDVGTWTDRFFVISQGSSSAYSGFGSCEGLTNQCINMNEICAVYFAKDTPFHVVLKYDLDYFEQGDIIEQFKMRIEVFEDMEMYEEEEGGVNLVGKVKESDVYYSLSGIESMFNWLRMKRQDTKYYTKFIAELLDYLFPIANTEFLGDGINILKGKESPKIPKHGFFDSENEEDVENDDDEEEEEEKLEVIEID